VTGRALESHRSESDGHTLVDHPVHLSFGTRSADRVRELPALVGKGVVSVKVHSTYRDSDYHTHDVTCLTRQF